MTIQIKAIEQYFHVVLFIMLYKVALTFKSVDETFFMQFFRAALFIMLYKILLAS